MAAPPVVAGSTVWRQDRLSTYLTWHAAQVRTGDLDPVYPVLARVLDTIGANEDQRVWAVLLHVAYYDLGSAFAAFAECPTPGIPTRHLPTGTERRNHRVPGRLEQHLAALLDAFDAHGGPFRWLVLRGTGWRDLSEHIAAVHGNGRWAAYKTAEMAQKVLALNTAATDAGHANSTGPRQGLATLLRTDLPLGNSPGELGWLNHLTAELAAHAGESDIAQVETSLCDWHSLLGGRYYLGHDIDQMQAQLLRTPSDLTPAAFAARSDTLPHPYLGELGGPQAWEGPDPERRKVFRDTGVLLKRTAQL